MQHYLLVPLLFSCTFCNSNIYFCNSYIYFCNLNATCPTSNAKLSVQQYLSVLWKVFLHGFETWYTRWVDKCKFNQIYLDIKLCHHMHQCSLEIVLPDPFLYLSYIYDNCQQWRFPPSFLLKLCSLTGASILILEVMCHNLTSFFFYSWIKNYTQLYWKLVSIVLQV